MVAVEVSGPSVETTEDDEVIMLKDGSSPVSQRAHPRWTHPSFTDPCEMKKALKENSENLSLTFQFAAQHHNQSQATFWL